MRTAATKSDQKPTGVSLSTTGGVSSAGGASASSGMGGRSSSYSSFSGAALSAFTGAAGTNAPLFTCSSSRVRRAFSALVSRLSSGWHSSTMHSSASMRRLALRVKPAIVS